MTTVGSYEAKTHLPALLKRVARGEKIMITVRGVPVAILAKPPAEEKLSVREAIKQMRALRKGIRLNRPGQKRLTIRDLIEEGRRF